MESDEVHFGMEEQRSLALEKPLDISAPVEYAQNDHMFSTNAIEDDIVTDGKTPQAGSEFVATPSDARIFRQEKKAPDDAIDYPTELYT